MSEGMAGEAPYELEERVGEGEAGVRREMKGEELTALALRAAAYALDLRRESSLSGTTLRVGLNPDPVVVYGLLGAADGYEEVTGVLVGRNGTEGEDDIDLSSLSFPSSSPLTLLRPPSFSLTLSSCSELTLRGVPLTFLVVCGDLDPKYDLPGLVGIGGGSAPVVPSRWAKGEFLTSEPVVIVLNELLPRRRSPIALGPPSAPLAVLTRPPAPTLSVLSPPWALGVRLAPFVAPGEDHPRAESETMSRRERSGDLGGGARMVD